MALGPWEKDGTIIEDGSGNVLECETCPCDETCCYPTIPATLTLTVTAVSLEPCVTLSSTCTLTWDSVDSWDGVLTSSGAGGCAASYAVSLFCPGDDNPDNFSLQAEFYDGEEAPNPGGTCSPLFLEISGNSITPGGAVTIEITE